MKIEHLTVATIVLLIGLVLFAAGAPAIRAQPRASGAYEVWIIDQADAARGGARLYIYDGLRLEAGQAGLPEVVNLEAAASGIGDGAGVRPHLLEFTATHSHAIIANVASGHVYVMRARDRRIVTSIDVGEQAHHAMASPDGAFLIVANQNGKRLARIRADFGSERFAHSRADDLNLAGLEDAAHPDNAPICPVLSGSKAYVTLRGGGLYIVDYRSTPMRVLKAYGIEQVGPAGCGGMVMSDKVYINSGTALTSNLYVLDRASDAILKHVRLSWTGGDGHGMVATGGATDAVYGSHVGLHSHMGGGRYLWMGNRGEGNIVVMNTSRDAVVGIITGVGAAPDIMALSPSGRRVYVALRGPNNLTGGPSAKGETPGFAILEVLDDGRNGRRIGFVPIGEQTLGSTSDVHALAIHLAR